MTDEPGYGHAQIIRGLGLPRRIGLVLAGLGGLAGATIIGVIWATEPGALPARTQASFAILMLVGLSWAAVAAFALARRPLFAVDRVVSAWLAVVFSTLMTIGMAVVALTRASIAALIAAGCVGLPLVVLAAVLLRRARAYRAALLTRKNELEAQGPQ